MPMMMTMTMSTITFMTANTWSNRKLSIFRGTRAVAIADSFSVKAVPDVKLMLKIGLDWIEDYDL